MECEEGGEASTVKPGFPGMILNGISFFAKEKTLFLANRVPNNVRRPSSPKVVLKMSPRNEYPYE